MESERQACSLVPFGDTPTPHNSRVTEPTNLCYMTRLGLWGPGAAFKCVACVGRGGEGPPLQNGSSKDPQPYYLGELLFQCSCSRAYIGKHYRHCFFVAVLSTGPMSSQHLSSFTLRPLPHPTPARDQDDMVDTLEGSMGAMEQVAMELKQSGCYLARTLSYGVCYVCLLGVGGAQELGRVDRDWRERDCQGRYMMTRAGTINEVCEGGKGRGGEDRGGEQRVDLTFPTIYPGVQVAAHHYSSGAQSDTPPPPAASSPLPASLGQ